MDARPDIVYRLDGCRSGESCSQGRFAKELDSDLFDSMTFGFTKDMIGRLSAIHRRDAMSTTYNNLAITTVGDCACRAGIWSAIRVSMLAMRY